MVQNDEDLDIREKSVKVQRTVETANPPENKVDATVKRKLISTATLKVLSEEGKKLSDTILKNPHAAELLKFQCYNLALSTLAGLEILPETALTSNIAKKILEIAQIAAKEGKKQGSFDDMYKGVPEFIKKIPIASELTAAVINQFKSYKEGVLFGKDVVTTYINSIKNIAHPPASVQQARLQFSVPRMA